MALHLKSVKSQFSKLRSGPWEVYLSKHKHKTQGRGKILSHDQIVFNLKSQLSKSGVMTYEEYLSKHKHKTQGKEKILRHDHMVFNLKF